MKKVLNISLTILLIITIFLVSFTMTILNNSFVKLDLTIHSYYDVVIDNINKEVKYEHYLDDKDVKSYVNNYIAGYYEERTYDNKIHTSEDNKNDELKEVYNRNIKFIKPMKNIKFYHDIFDIATIIFIMLTGFVFVKTKGKHSLNIILIISSIIGVIISGIIFVMNSYTGIMYTVITDSIYVYLGINLFILLLITYIKIIKKYKIICK